MRRIALAAALLAATSPYGHAQPPRTVGSTCAENLALHAVANSNRVLRNITVCLGGALVRVDELVPLGNDAVTGGPAFELRGNAIIALPRATTREEAIQRAR